ncbi:tetratricopeptide repeat protein [Sandaracinus amylolyticus]|uniref:TPR domain protein, putative component of TonB system n=1 Tax=Sandaracinus amylolyticus TaxID=927083 RepID=A0A0F6W7A5_9BACT|nr:tetratricopeptide repeat protein [Sandaracinus amylolyticus]AKF09127.1 TPR domain protein, putative component of TonB system [Sandaracinus amylolyticus]
MKRVVVLTLLLALASPASAQRGQAGARFQTPAAESRIETEGPTEDERAQLRGDDEGGAPEDLEERLYLRERPDALGAAAREWHDAQLETLLRDRERLAGERRDQAIALLEEFVREEPETAAEMPDALLRLAELRWELARSQYLERFAAWQQVPEENRGAEPAPDYRPAITLYDRILEQHRGYDRYDFVLYMKAYALTELQDLEGALALYRRILRDFPQSRFVPDAHMALAEAAFANLEFEAALPEFEQVLRYRDSELYDMALFKSAWCLWRMNRTTEAATRFRQVLDLGRDRGQLTSAQRRRLRDLQSEALDYLIQVFTEDERNTAQDVFRFLEEIGGERYAGRVLSRLSLRYMDDARYDQGIAAYRLLLEMEPASEDAPLWAQQIAAGYAALDDSQHTLEALTALADGYLPGGSWAQQQSDPEVVEAARTRIERAIRVRAMRWHELGQRDDQRTRFEWAERGYDLYLEHFPESESAYDLHFYRAEILFHRLERYPEAGDEYLAAARRNPQGEHTRDALYNAIGAFERVREGQLETCTRTRGTTPARPPVQPPAQPPAEGAAEDPCGETENDVKFSEAIELYVELFPNDPDLPEILFRQGRLYYDRGIYDPAVRLFGQLLERFPQSEYAATAGELILDSFNRAQDYANIETWARRLKTAPSFQNAQAQQRLDTLILQAVFALGEQLAGRGEHGEAAAAYQRAAEEFPRDPRARQAWYNAGLERQRAGDLAGASSAYDRLIELHPGSSEGALAAWSGAQMMESIAQFSDAARFYEAYGTRFPQGEHAADSLYNAVLLRLAAEDWDDAVRAANAFLERHARDAQGDEVSFMLARAHEGAERWAEAARVYTEYARRSRNPDRDVEAQTRLAQVLLRAEDRAGADRALQQAVRTGRGALRRLGERGRYWLAQARYLQGELVLREFETVQIAGPVDGLRQRLERKSQLLRDASTAFAEVVELRVAELVTAALFQIGRSYELFAQSLREFEVPPNLTEEEDQAYRDQLAMFIIPIEEQALQAYEGGYQQAIELRIFNSWTAQLREGLTRLNDVQYPPFREMGADIVEGVPLPPPQPLDGLRRGEPAAPENAPAATTTPTPSTPTSGEATQGERPREERGSRRRRRSR